VEFSDKLLCRKLGRQTNLPNLENLHSFRRAGRKIIILLAIGQRKLEEQGRP
jgi:hypothetical protein